MKTKNNKGLTLIEILVVIAIIGILTTIGAVAVRYAKTKAMIAKAEHDLDQIYKAITTLSYDTNLWPGGQIPDQVGSGSNNEICATDINGNNCVDGSSNPIMLSSATAGIVATDGTYTGWQGPYMHKIPIDAWDYEYFFDTDYSLDVDGKPCGCGGGGCIDVVVVGSYGPDGQGVPSGSAAGSYGCDDIIKIITR